MLLRPQSRIIDRDDDDDSDDRDLRRPKKRAPTDERVGLIANQTKKKRTVATKGARLTLHTGLVPWLARHNPDYISLSCPGARVLVRLLYSKPGDKRAGNERSSWLGERKGDRRW